MMEEALNHAIGLIRAGKLEPARQVLAQVLKGNPDHEQAWLWISNCFSEQERKAYCFQRVLKVNPNNQAARDALAALQAPPTPPASSLAPAAPAPQPVAANPAIAQPATALAGPALSVPTQPSLAEQLTEPETVERAEARGRKKLRVASANINRLQKRVERHKYSGVLSFFLSLLFVTVIAGAVWAGLNYLLPDDIPITQAQLKSHLTSIGVFCGSPEPADGATGYAYVRHCNGYPGAGRVQVSVDVYSEKNPVKVDLILAYATQLRGDPTTAEMGDLLAHVAMLPYSNARPEQAKAWVEQNFPALLTGQYIEDPEIQLGRVRLHLASLNNVKKYLALGRGQN